MSISEPSGEVLARLQRELQSLDRAQAAELAQLQDRHRRERAALVARLMLLVAPHADGINDQLTPGRAQHEFGLSKSVLRRLGDKHPMGEPGGFCLTDDGGNRWYSRSLLRAHLSAHPPRRQGAKARSARGLIGAPDPSGPK